MTRVSAGCRRRAAPCAAGLAVAAVVLAGCGGTVTGTASPAPTASGSDGSSIGAGGPLAAPGEAHGVFTYDAGLAPPGGTVTVTAGTTAGTDTTVTLEVTGLRPDRGYAAHVHAKPCGPTGAAAGPHHQHRPDPAATPETPSSDPAYANPRNEIWLDLRTDGTGAGSVTAEVPFVFGDQKPGSVVLHEAEKTSTEPGKAGTAGARIACVAVPFDELRPG